MAYAIAGVAQVAIARIFPPRLTQSHKVSLNFTASRGQQRPYQVLFSLCGKDSSETVSTRAPEDAHHDRLCLVVDGVGSRDFVDHFFAYQLREPKMPQLAGCGLHAELVCARVSWNIRAARIKLKAKCLRQCADVLLIGIGFSAADSVMKMRHRQNDSQVLAQLTQHSQQGYRIGPARDGYGHTVSGLQKPLVANVLVYLLNHTI